MRIVGGSVFGTDHKMHNTDMCFENGVITEESQSGEFDASDCFVLPGLIGCGRYRILSVRRRYYTCIGLVGMSRSHRRTGLYRMCPSGRIGPEYQKCPEK